MQRIQIMDEPLANQIAAGEVVDRPASVVKELVENAIDAQSSVIEVVIEEGGLEKIRIADNGTGMSREDSKLSFERHATSKLKSNADLFRISTLGFRGEALSSIAAVSKVFLQTWDQEAETGTYIKVEGGSVQEVEDAPLRPGTIVEVTDLFYNTPARYKYVKTVHTELSHITDMINRLALAHPTISFTLQHKGRQILKTPGNGDMRSVIASIYGMKTARQMISHHASHIDFELKAFLSKPELSRASRSHVSLLINGRYVKSYSVVQALLRAYHTLLPVHRYPIAILSLTMDASLIDVNVHPTKLEVRLSKENELTEWLETECKRALQNEQLIPAPYTETKQREKKTRFDQPELALRLPEKNKQHDGQNAPPLVREPASQSEVTEPERAESQQLHTAQGDVSAQESNSHGSNASVDHEPGGNHHQLDQGRENGSDAVQHNKDVESKIPFLTPLAQLHGMYILAQNEQGLYMIDQHAAQERIWYEKFSQKFNEPVRANQTLAVPLILEFTAAENEVVQEHVDVFENMGLFLENFGHHAYMIRSVPHWFPEGEEESIIREVISYVTEHKRKMDWIHVRDEAAQLMSCKQAIKANRYLTHKEMERLVEDLRHTSNPFTCPHGRPITVLLSKYDIEKMFKRVM